MRVAQLTTDIRPRSDRGRRACNPHVFPAAPGRLLVRSLDSLRSVRCLRILHVFQRTRLGRVLRYAFGQPNRGANGKEAKDSKKTNRSPDRTERNPVARLNATTDFGRTPVTDKQNSIFGLTSADRSNLLARLKKNAAGGAAGGIVYLGNLLNLSGNAFTVFALLAATLFGTATGSSIGTLLTAVPLLFPAGVALGADACYIGTAALLAMGCHLCRTCQTGKCNWGIATQRPELVKRLNPDIGSQRLINLLTAWDHELKEMMGGMGINSIEALRGNRLMLRGIGLTDRELNILGIKHAGE